MGDLGKIMDEMKKEIISAAEQEVTQTAGNIYESARNLVPVVTGKLRNSIKVTSQGSLEREGIVNYMITAGDENAPYAAFVEFGIGREGASSVGAIPEAQRLMERIGYKHGTKKGFPGRLFMTRSYVQYGIGLEDRIGKRIEGVLRRFLK